VVELLAGLAVLAIGILIGFELRGLEQKIEGVDARALKAERIEALERELVAVTTKQRAHEADLGTIAMTLDIKRED
jgi:hypothetical protein